MIVVPCPSCGKPARVVLSRPDDLSCDACGHHGPMPAEARERLAEGAKALSAMQLGDRQLSAAQRGTLDRARKLATGQGCVTAVLGVFFAPFLLGGLYAFFHTLSEGNVGAALIVVALLVPPLLVFTGLSWLGRRHLHGPVVRLRAACAATPPRRPGEPATCHVCGAPVDTAAGQAVSRCAYCSADNLVDAPALRAGAARRAIDVADVAAAITREARSLGGVAIASYATVITTLVAIPVVTFASLVASFLVSMEVELPAESKTYAVVELGKKKCMGEASDGKALFGSKPPAGFPTSTPVGHSELVSAARLAGRTLEDGRRIVRVISHPPGQNWMVLDSGPEAVPLGACLR